MAAHLPVPRTFGEFIHTGQVLAGGGVEVPAWNTGGAGCFARQRALFWQLNDCWPVTSWAVMYSDLQPKAAYYYAKRFFAPRPREHDTEGRRTWRWWGTNDNIIRGGWARPLRRLSSMGGETLWKGAYPAAIPANGSALLRIVRRTSWGGWISEPHMFVRSCASGGGPSR